MTTPPSLTRRDIDYVTEEYRTLAQLCAGRELTPAEARALIDSGQLPRPTYVLPGGDERFPPDFFALVDAAGSVEALPGWFRTRYLTVADNDPRAEADAADDWAGFLSGEFGVCLRAVCVESMIEKNRLTRLIDRLLAAPQESDPRWQAELRRAVDSLDDLLRPFTDYDRQRWGDTSRDQRITRVRARFPAIFHAEAEVRASDQSEETGEPAVHR
jgi:hypothetical protein